jgi:single-strand DNA-binding protein
MAGVNKVILLGNLGTNPEVKHLESGSVVARISLATSESYKDKDGNKIDATEWHDIELWDGLAKVAEKYLKQGDTIYIEGKIKSNKWTDDQGNNRKSTRIRAINMTMVSRKQTDPLQPNTPQPQDIPSGDSGAHELPF